MLRKKQNIVISALIIFALIWSCKKDDVIIKPEYTNTINIPLPLLDEVEFKAIDLINELDSSSREYLHIGEDSLLFARYDTTFEAVWSDLVEFNELTINNTFTLDPTNKSSTRNDSVFYDSLQVDFIAGQSFDSVKIGEANFNLTVNTPTSGLQGTYTFRMPGLIYSNRDTLEFTHDDFTTPMVKDTALNGSWLKFVEDGENTYLIMEIIVDAEPDGNPITDLDLSFELELTNLKPDLIFGYFGTMDVIEETQDFPFDFFETLELPAEIRFKEMSIDIGINNYFGVPLGIRVDSMVFSKEGETPVQVEPEPIVIAPAVYSEQIVPVYDSILIDETVPGLMDGINMVPEKVFIDFVGSINPEATPMQNFIAAENILDGIAKIEVPLWFNTSLYQRKDTLDMELETENLEYVEKVDLYFDFINSFPFNVSANAFVIDDQGTSLGYIFEDSINLIQSPIIDPVTGTSSAPSNSQVVVTLNSDKLVQMKEDGGNKIVLETWVQVGQTDDPNTVPNEEVFVKLLASNKMVIKLSLNASGDIN